MLFGVDAGVIFEKNFKHQLEMEAASRLKGGRKRGKPGAKDRGLKDERSSCYSPWSIRSSMSVSCVSIVHEPS